MEIKAHQANTKKMFCCFGNWGFSASGKLKHILKREIVEDQKVIWSMCYIEHINYILYFGLSGKTTMQPDFDSMKIPILRRGKQKAGREKFWKHQNPKSGKKSVNQVMLVDSFL